MEAALCGALGPLTQVEGALQWGLKMALQRLEGLS